MINERVKEVGFVPYTDKSLCDYILLRGLSICQILNSFPIGGEMWIAIQFNLLPFDWLACHRSGREAAMADGAFDLTWLDLSLYTGFIYNESHENLMYILNSHSNTHLGHKSVTLL